MATNDEIQQNFAWSQHMDNRPTTHGYEFNTDTLAVITTAAYFNILVTVGLPLKISDQILIKGSDADGLFSVTTVTPDVTLAAIGGGGPPVVIPPAPPVFFDPSLMLESTGAAPTIFFIGSFQKSARFIDGTGSGINWSMPSDFLLDSNVTVTLEWSPDSANAGDVDWNFNFGAKGPGEVIGFQGSVAQTIAVPGVTNEVVNTVFVLPGAANSFAAGKSLALNFSRVGTSTYADPTNVLGIYIDWIRV